MKLESSRRAFLGTTAALGAGGLAGLTSAASAQDAVKPDAGNPGDGGFGRQVSQLPPGRPVAYHDPKDVGEMPDFRVRLTDQAENHIRRLGQGVTGTSSRSSRALRAFTCSSTPAARASCTGTRSPRNGPMSSAAVPDRCSTPQARARSTIMVRAICGSFRRDMAIRSRRSATRPAISSSLSITALSPSTAPSRSPTGQRHAEGHAGEGFRPPEGSFRAFPKGETYIQAGPVIPADAIDAPWPKEFYHKFRLIADARAGAISTAARSASPRSTNGRCRKRCREA